MQHAHERESLAEGESIASRAPKTRHGLLLCAEMARQDTYIESVQPAAGAAS